MQPFLTFVLSAPLAAMGEVAVGEWRGGQARPARSAVLGLIAGCLGLLREDEAGQSALQAGLGLAMQVCPPGAGLIDYHTAQLAEPRRGVLHRNRAAELAVERKDLKTVLSRREYRGDMRVLVAVWTRAECDWQLRQVEEALRRPAFIPYFGRRSCPLDRPMAPVISEAGHAVAALAARAQAEGWEATGQVVMDAVDAETWGLPALRVERRRDAVASRRRWQFGLREEAVLRRDGPA